MTLYKPFPGIYIKPKWLPVAGLQMFPMRKLQNSALVQFLSQRNMQLSMVLKSRSCPLIKSFKGTFLAGSRWKLRMGTYGWVSIQPSQLKKANPRTGFDVTLMSSSAEFYSFSLSGRLRAVGLDALARLVTVIYMNCAIGHFRVPVRLSFKASLNAKSLLW